MDFDLLVEKIKNPLRKQELGNSPQRITDYDQSYKDWKNYILNGEVVDSFDLEIKNKYLIFKKSFPDRAEIWLDQQAKQQVTKLLGMRLKIENPVKIYSKDGVDVFIDKYTDIYFTKDSIRMKHVKKSVDYMLLYTKEILPNRKPKIIITNGSRNPHFVKVDGINAPAIYIDRLIYIDQNNVHKPKYFVHELAHFVVDLIPKQTEPLLKKAYNDMLDIYWKSAKVKKQRLQAEDPNDKKQVLEAERWRRAISKKLGFPEYGLRNFDEFFAVLIENWKNLPANTATYKFKSLVKNVLTRL